MHKEIYPLATPVEYLNVEEIYSKESLMKKYGLFIVLIVALSLRFFLSYIRLVYGFYQDKNLETYADFSGYYLQWLKFFSSGYLPYRDFAYTYPPFFLYFLYPFYLFNSAMLPIVLFDALTSILVFKIVEGRNYMLGFYAGLTYAILPLSLLYAGYVWFSVQPFLFFSVLSLYLLLVNKINYAAISFGFSLLIKQQALIFMVPFLIYFLQKKETNKLARFFSISICLFIAGSLPYLLLFPSYYLNATSLRLIGQAPSSYVISSNLVQNITWKLTNITLLSTPNCTKLAPNTNVCVFNTITYTEIYSPPPILDTLLHYLLIPYALIPVLVFVYMRKRHHEINLFQFSAVILNLIFCLVFFLYFEYPYRYYFIPLYLLLIVGSNRSLLLGLIFSVATISLIAPSGNIQPVIFSIGLMVYLFFLSRSKNLRYS